jgi:hypothetical protein
VIAPFLSSLRPRARIIPLSQVISHAAPADSLVLASTTINRPPPTAPSYCTTFRVWRLVDPLKRILQRLQSSSKGFHIMSATQSILSRNHWPELVEVDGLRTTWSPAELY